MGLYLGWSPLANEKPPYFDLMGDSPVERSVVCSRRSEACLSLSVSVSLSAATITK